MVSLTSLTATHKFLLFLSFELHVQDLLSHCHFWPGARNLECLPEHMSWPDRFPPPQWGMSKTNSIMIALFKKPDRDSYFIDPFLVAEGREQAALA